MPYGLSRLREHEPWLLGPRWVSRAVTYLFFVALGLLMLSVALPVAIAIVVAVAFAALWLLLKTTAERLADARVRAVDTDRRPNSPHALSVVGPHRGVGLAARAVRRPRERCLPSARADGAPGHFSDDDRTGDGCRLWAGVRRLALHPRSASTHRSLAEAQGLA